MTDRYPIPDFLRRQPEQPAGPRERPVLFSAPMVRAILAGTKTQTRRVLKGVQPWGVKDGRPEWAIVGTEPRCPYGKPGDQIWVRENGWERPERTPKMMREGADTWAPYYFDADGYGSADAEQFKEWGFKRRPSIHMPRWASRILLEITAVRVERLNDISETDAMAEGCQPDTPETWWQGYVHMESIDDLVHVTSKGEAPPDDMIEPKKMKPRTHLLRSAKDRYRALWESINGAGSWGANPWVWVVGFKRVQP